MRREPLPVGSGGKDRRGKGVFAGSLPFSLLLFAAGLLLFPSCRSAPYGLGKRLQKLQSSLAGLGGAVDQEFRRAGNLPSGTAELLRTVPARDLTRGARFTGSFFSGEMRRARKGALALGGAAGEELRRTETLVRPGPILWNYLGSEPARASGALREAVLLWRNEWTSRLARDPYRLDEPGSYRAEVPSLPKPLTMGKALLVSLPLW